jgi:hypothetical protein
MSVEFRQVWEDWIVQRQVCSSLFLSGPQSRYCQELQWLGFTECRRVQAAKKKEGYECRFSEAL